MDGLRQPAGAGLAREAATNNLEKRINGSRHDRTADGRGVARAPQDEDNIHVSFGQKLLSASAGSLVTSLIVNPLDVVRVRLQSQHITQYKPSSPSGIASSLARNSPSHLPPNLGISACCREVFWISNNAEFCMAINLPITGSGLGANTLGDKSSVVAAECAAEETKRKIYTSTLDGLRKISKNEGPLTLWRGLTPTLAMAIPANVIYFAGYDWLRYNRESPFRKLNVPQYYIPLMAGSSARVLAAFSINPIELFRTRMQASTLHTGKRGGNMVDTFNGLKEMVAARGYKSLWTGLSLTLWRDVPFSAIYWWGYEQLRETIRASQILQSPGAKPATISAGSFPSPAPNQQSAMSKLRNETHFQTFAGSALAGAGAGAFAALVTTPFDVGKTRQQVIKYQKRSASGGTTASSLAGAVASSTGRVLPEELSMPRFLMHIFRTEGTSGLFMGWAARCLKVAPACAIMITVYEIGKKVSTERNNPT